MAQRGELKEMTVRPAISAASGNLGVTTGVAPLRITTGRFLCLNVGDWSVVFVGLGMAALLLALVS